MKRAAKSLDSLPGPTLFRAIRLLGRAPVQQDQRQFSGILVVQAVRGCQERPEPGEVTVRSVADYMHVAPSTASRLVADAVEARYVESVPSKSDRRSTALRLTARGRQLLRSSVEYQTKVYEQATEGWSEESKKVFEVLLVDFCHRLIDQG
ncbi:DNA-binding MarR family transcriptional regulator [Prauserella isguenensis]|uniref:DNA-binding MarR family transcriptional regulator n=1 Tax=Prauserella isguenensis TaxID=1470180 RepID=A0A839S806_9PSEU|nr:MarR family winged helix-turn-helix transcriptional regulator [Prauserella isguenensis]MBB3053120.1 DNA-binding MarR family transcriptional regulator [Prauserella isguenensis]